MLVGEGVTQGSDTYYEKGLQNLAFGAPSYKCIQVALLDCLFPISRCFLPPLGSHPAANLYCQLADRSVVSPGSPDKLTILWFVLLSYYNYQRHLNSLSSKFPSFSYAPLE